MNISELPQQTEKIVLYTYIKYICEHNRDILYSDDLL